MNCFDMPCQHPIWIRNRRYYSRDSIGTADYRQSQLALAPWDVSRQWLMVPCGKCADCLRRQRNDWFVRIERELSRCKAEKQQAVFVTITIDSLLYDKALADPSSYIRKWNERLRHRIGHSFKHVFFQEFGTHSITGSEPRLHFHGFLFGCNVSYSTIRSALSGLGFVWLANASLKRARYVVKYVTKQIDFKPEDVQGKFVTIDGVKRSLAWALCDRRYTRKFCSAHVGDWLGRRRAPSLSVSTWSYTDFKSRVRYNYAIPRYYDRYLQPAHKQARSILSADTYARFSRDRLVRSIVGALVKLLPAGASSVSSRETYVWQLKKYRYLSSAGSLLDIQVPAWINEDILVSWKDIYGLDLSLINVT